MFYLTMHSKHFYLRLYGIHEITSLYKIWHVPKLSHGGDILKYYFFLQEVRLLKVRWLVVIIYVLTST